jgi:hypothetical protein
MPYYKAVLDTLDRKTAARVADNLLRLRTRLKKEIPTRNVQDSVLVATWNLREFGANKKSGIRLDESILFIA